MECESACAPKYNQSWRFNLLSWGGFKLQITLFSCNVPFQHHVPPSLNKTFSSLQFYSHFFLLYYCFFSTVSFHFSSLVLELLHFTISDCSQTWQLADYHKIIGSGYWEDPGKCWPHSPPPTKTHCHNLHCLSCFFMSFFIQSYSISPTICYGQIRTSGIPHNRGLHSFTWSLVPNTFTPQSEAI